ncbi:cuticle protein 7-like [Galleria mellonella]|uniref:Cuticle protein 7-like n=1 Tax=Galleria mellonella TaxID=7137 RepID=A0A6J1X8J5_GALME|nr:cuticle protein 7-like [Galleria mellonella]
MNKTSRTSRIMMKKLIPLFYIILSITCTVLHQPVPILYGIDYHHTPNYNFAYEVNDAHTGDVKNQHELRRGDTVIGQYSLLQPDGIRRTVDYRADDHTGFQATVNNNGRPINQPRPEINDNAFQNDFGTHNIRPWPSPTVASVTQAPVAISRTSLVQSFPNIHIANPWI